MSSTKAPILLLGGTGKVAKRIAKQLEALKQPVLVASRSASGANGVAFDWNDQKTWDNAFAAHSGIKAIFLVAPPILEPLPIMAEYIAFAQKQGVRRFVLLSASSFEAGGPLMGKVHAHLKELGEKGEIEWAVLRPTWFQENLAESPVHAGSIKNESKIYSATSDGKVPFVSADDIAAVAVQSLTREAPPNTDYVVLGPELLSYSEVADLLTAALGRRIVHVNLSSIELDARLQSAGIPKDYSQYLCGLDTEIKHGAENRTNDHVLAVTGKAPRRYADYIESAKSAWQ